mmetsp:Transcript_79658/g.141042  ORF Transcript_79658/g.141042 Transcript_79658/m.141042 type:complete len:96 (+) Transcript_79658:124-411(+)
MRPAASGMQETAIQALSHVDAINFVSPPEKMHGPSNFYVFVAFPVLHPPVCTFREHAGKAQRKHVEWTSMKKKSSIGLAVVAPLVVLVKGERCMS